MSYDAEYFCPHCGAILNEQYGLDPDNGSWTCTCCGQELYDLSLSPEELALLNKLHDARNDLSHLRILTESVVKELAELSGR